MCAQGSGNVRQALRQHAAASRPSLLCGLTIFLLCWKTDDICRVLPDNTLFVLLFKTAFLCFGTGLGRSVQLFSEFIRHWVLFIDHLIEIVCECFSKAKAKCLFR